MELKGRTAVVTGAASGIGRACAIALAEAGAAIVVADVDEAGAEETANRIADRGGVAVFVRTDVRRVGDLEAMLDRAAEVFGGVDIVHNNAGIVSGTPGWPETSLERLSDVIAVNLQAVVVGTRLAVPHLRRRGGGVVVNTASVAAVRPLPGDPVYAATKAGVAMFTQSCAGMRERDNIRVNAVLPGMTDTPIINKTGDGTRPADWLTVDPAAMIQPEEVAAVVLRLVRDDSVAGATCLVPEGP